MDTLLSSPLSFIATVGSILTIVSIVAILKNAIQRRKRKVLIWGYVLAISFVVGMLAAVNAPGGDEAEITTFIEKNVAILGFTKI